MHARDCYGVRQMRRISCSYHPIGASCPAGRHRAGRHTTRYGDQPLTAGPASGQLLLTDVSSTTKLVWSEESSTIRNFTVIVLPLYADRSNVFCEYVALVPTLE